MNFAILDSNMPHDWFDFLGNRVPADQAEVLFVSDDHLDSYPNHPFKIALLIEPPLRKPYAYANVYKNYHDFKYVFSYHEDILNNLPNARVCYFGGAAIPMHQWGVYPKSKLVSTIASLKRDLPGTIMRHDLITRFGDRIDVYGLGNPIPGNFLGLKDYMFNICFENSRTNSYYTEKICDCFLTGTIPIYWGTDTITKLFNPNGIIQVNSVDDMKYVLDNLSYDLYVSKLSAVYDNFEIAKTKGMYQQNILETLRSIQ